MQHGVPSAPAKQMRNSAVELLRALAMFLIVLSHACVHSRFDLTAPGFGINRILVQCGVLGNLGVDIFVLISGYFLSVKGVSARGLLKLLLQIWFYSLTLFLGCRVFFGYPYSVGDYHRVFLPILFGEYWFCTAYVILFLLTPFLNLLIGAMDQKMHQKLIALILCLWSVLPTITGQYMYGDVLAQFIILYMIGAYIRWYPGVLSNGAAARGGLAVLSALLLVILTVIYDYLSVHIALFQNSVTALYGRNSPVILGCAVGMFAVTVSCRPFYSKFINSLGACAFGIYLIHDNPAVREILWNWILKHGDYYDSPVLLLRILLSVILVYTACAAAEFLRIRYLEQHLLKLSMRIMGKIMPGKKADRT